MRTLHFFTLNCILTDDRFAKSLSCVKRHANEAPLGFQNTKNLFHFHLTVCWLGFGNLYVGISNQSLEYEFVK